MIVLIGQWRRGNVMKYEINKDIIVKRGNDLLEYSQDFGEYIKQFLNIIDSINSVWEGADSLKYINVMKERFVPGLEKMNSVIKEYGDYLKKVPEVYDLIDEIYSSKNIDV